MIDNVKNLLPIGTVVTLKGGTKKLMIFGVIQNVADGDKKGEYDYIGVPYPEGNMGQDFQYLFNHEDVDNVYFRGFEDVERQEFVFNLSEYYKQLGQAK